MTGGRRCPAGSSSATRARSSSSSRLSTICCSLHTCVYPGTRLCVMHRNNKGGEYSAVGRKEEEEEPPDDSGDEPSNNAANAKALRRCFASGVAVGLVAFWLCSSVLSAATGGGPAAPGSSNSSGHATAGNPLPAPGPGWRCAPAYAPGLHEIQLESGRRFLLAVPSLTTGKQPLRRRGGGAAATAARVPAMVDWHGYTESPHYQNQLVGLAKAAEEYGWVGVLPYGTAPVPTATCCPNWCDEACCRTGKALDPANACSWNSPPANAPRRGCCGEAVRADTDDVGFARAIVRWLGKHTCTDVQRVFTTGFSNGAMFANRLGCEAADIFRGVAPVEGGFSGEYGEGFSACVPSRPISWLSVCGTEDRACIATFNETAQKWADLNSCNVVPGGGGGAGAGTQPPAVSFESATTKCTVWRGCANNTFVEKCLVYGLTHEWSGGLRPNGGYDGRISPPRPATDLRATRYIFDRFSTLKTDECVVCFHGLSADLIPVCCLSPSLSVSPLLSLYLSLRSLTSHWPMVSVPPPAIAAQAAAVDAARFAWRRGFCVEPCAAAVTLLWPSTSASPLRCRPQAHRAVSAHPAPQHRTGMGESSRTAPLTKSAAPN